MAALKSIGKDTQHYVNGVPQFDTPNHNYDTSDFNQLVSAIKAGKLGPGALPAVSFVKAPGFQDGHGAYSDPIDEQEFVVNEINLLQSTASLWPNTAIVVNYDDSDGWYDHAYSGVKNPSDTVADFLTGTGTCGTGTPGLGGEQGRCGYGPRLPMLVISPWARQNFVDHTLSDQSSITKFIEDNWSLGQIDGSYANVAGALDTMFTFTNLAANRRVPNTHKLLLDPNTGEPTG
jgi:phospholipase C